MSTLLNTIAVIAFIAALATFAGAASAIHEILAAIFILISMCCLAAAAITTRLDEIKSSLPTEPISKKSPPS